MLDEPTRVVLYLIAFVNVIVCQMCEHDVCREFACMFILKILDDIKMY